MRRDGSSSEGSPEEDVEERKFSSCSSEELKINSKPHSLPNSNVNNSPSSKAADLEDFGVEDQDEKSEKRLFAGEMSGSSSEFDDGDELMKRRKMSDMDSV